MILLRFSNFYALIFLVIFLIFASGCTGISDSGPKSFSPIEGLNNCTTPEECSAYCSANIDACENYCYENPSVCKGFSGTKNSGMPMAGTACDMELVREKMQKLTEEIFVSPPHITAPPVWMTKILPAGNPYPGYYYAFSSAFGPAVDAQKGTAWSGEGEPPLASGLDYYVVGIWDEKPKGLGATLGEQTPGGLDLSRYQLTVFYTNVSAPSQSAMIYSLPDLSMSEAEAKAFFSSVIKKSFIDLEGKSLFRAGPKMYEVRWHDSEDTQDYWDVQIASGYIAIGQGKVYTAESMLEGDPGTMWLYHACRPCRNCYEWTVETIFNKDCSEDSDCMGGLCCNDGNCVKPKSATSQTGKSSDGSCTGMGPGSPCSSAEDCGAGLLCKDDVCTIPAGR